MALVRDIGDAELRRRITVRAFDEAFDALADLNSVLTARRILEHNPTLRPHVEDILAAIGLTLWHPTREHITEGVRV